MKARHIALVFAVCSSLALTLLFTNATPATFIADSKHQRFIAACYVTFFARVPEKSGMDYWLNEITVNKLSYAQVAQGFYNAAVSFRLEDFDKPMTPEQFVEKIYLNIANRSYPSQVSMGERDYWVKRFFELGRNHGALVAEFIPAVISTNIEIYTTWTESQKSVVRNGQATFLNKIHLGLIAYQNNFTLTGTAAEITQKGKAVLANVNHTQDSVYLAITNPYTGLKLTTFPRNYKYKILILGQSNAANFASSAYDTKTFVTVFDPHGKYEKFYADSNHAAYSSKFVPWDGVTSPTWQGSVWGKLGDRLNSLNTRIMFDTRAIGSSSVADWSPIGGVNGTPGRFHSELTDALRDNSFDIVIYQQGEQESAVPMGMTSAQMSAYYAKHLSETVKTIVAKYPNIKIFVTKTSKVERPGGIVSGSPAVIEGQRRVVDASLTDNVRWGIDTDSISQSYRTWNDLNHFNEQGVNRQVDLWIELFNFYRL